MLREEITKIYQELQLELDRLPARCYGCGACCNFKKNGMELYAQKMEKDLIVEETGVVPFLRDTGECNFQENNLCTIHRIRPLGCRTYFSEAANSIEHQELFEMYHKRIKELGRQNNFEYQFVPFFRR